MRKKMQKVEALKIMPINKNSYNRLRMAAILRNYPLGNPAPSILFSPTLSSSLTAPTLSDFAAACSAVQPVLMAMLGSAPCLIRIGIMRMSRPEAAAISGVQPGRKKDTADEAVEWLHTIRREGLHSTWSKHTLK